MTAAKRGGLQAFAERRHEARGVTMRALVAGEGAPVALVHGLGGAASNWVAVAPALAERHRVVVLDLPGHGGSSALPAAPNLDAYADRVRLVLEAEDALPAVVVGHSLGALVGLRLALRWPEAVTGLVLVSAAGIASGTRWAEFWLHVFGALRLGKLVAPHRARVAASAWARRLVFGYWGASDVLAMRDECVEGFLAGPELHADTWSAMKALVRDDPRADLTGVRCPALVLWGARDHQVPVADALEYARRLGAELRVVADCGHLLIGERPDACLDALDEFARRL